MTLVPMVPGVIPPTLTSANRKANVIQRDKVAAAWALKKDSSCVQILAVTYM